VLLEYYVVILAVHLPLM